MHKSLGWSSTDPPPFVMHAQVKLVYRFWSPPIVKLTEMETQIENNVITTTYYNYEIRSFSS